MALTFINNNYINYNWSTTTTPKASTLSSTATTSFIFDLQPLIYIKQSTTSSTTTQQPPQPQRLININNYSTNDNINSTNATTTTMQRQPQLMQYACGTKIQGRALTALNNKVFQSISSHRFEWHCIPGPRSSPLLNNKVFQDMSPPALNDKAFQSISSHRFEWQCIWLQLCISTYNMTTPTTTTNRQCIHLRMTCTTTIQQQQLNECINEIWLTFQQCINYSQHKRIINNLHYRMHLRI